MAFNKNAIIAVAIVAVRIIVSFFKLLILILIFVIITTCHDYQTIVRQDIFSQ